MVDLGENMNSASDSSTEPGRLIREVIVPNVRPPITSVIAMAVIQFWAGVLDVKLAVMATLTVMIMAMTVAHQDPLPPLTTRSRLLPIMERIEREQRFESERSYIDPALSRMLLDRRACGVRIGGDGTRRHPLRIAEPGGTILLVRSDATPPMMGVP